MLRLSTPAERRPRACEQNAVGGHDEPPQAGQGRDPFEELHDAGPNQRLSAGDPNLFDPDVEGGPGDPRELFIAEQAPAPQAFQATCRHAVTAAQVAAIRHG